MYMHAMSRACPSADRTMRGVSSVVPPAMSAFEGTPLAFALRDCGITGEAMITEGDTFAGLLARSQVV